MRSWFAVAVLSSLVACVPPPPHATAGEGPNEPQLLSAAYIGCRPVNIAVDETWGVWGGMSAWVARCGERRVICSMARASFSCSPLTEDVGASAGSSGPPAATPVPAQREAQ